MNLILLKAGYPPVVIEPEDRIVYLNSLEKLQLEDDAQPYYEFLWRRLETTLDEYLEKLKPDLPA